MGARPSAPGSVASNAASSPAARVCATGRFTTGPRSSSRCVRRRRIEGVVRRDQPFIADGSPSVARQPGEGALRLLAMLPEPVVWTPRSSAGSGAGCRAPRTPCDSAGSHRPCPRSASPGGSAAIGPSAHGDDGVSKPLEQSAAVHVGGGRHEGEQDALAVDAEVVLRAWLASVGGILADGGSPVTAKRQMSRLAGVQSMRLAAAARPSMSWCSLRHTPTALTLPEPPAGHPRRPQAPASARAGGSSRAARTDCRSASPGNPPSIVRPSAGHGAGTAAALPSPTTRQSPAASCRGAAPDRRSGCETASRDFNAMAVRDVSEQLRLSAVASVREHARTRAECDRITAEESGCAQH